MQINTKTYQQKLTEELEILTSELQNLGIHNPQVKEDWVSTPEKPIEGEADPNDAADTKEDWMERRAVLSQLETRYNNIVKALQKIDSNTYGHCEVCNSEIPEARLTANPAASTCMEHMEEASTATQ